MKFEKFNANPLKKKVGDCVIRAIAKGLNKSWIEVYDDLTVLGRRMFSLPNCKDVYIEYLKDYPMFTEKVIKGEKRKKVKDFIKGTYILLTARHLTCVKDGVLYDLWDSREKTVYRYWVIKENK